MAFSSTFKLLNAKRILMTLYLIIYSKAQDSLAKGSELIGPKNRAKPEFTKKKGGRSPVSFS